MITNPAFYVGIHHCSFRAGEPGLIKGVEFKVPENQTAAVACFIVHYYSGGGVDAVDYPPINDTAHYKIICAADVVKKRIPEATQ